MTFFIKTFGCQMNVADSERLESYYLARGYQKAASIEKAERMSGYKVEGAYVGVAGSHIQSLNTRGVVAIGRGDRPITQEDVDRAMEAAQAVAVPHNRQIIHAIPRGFSLDEQDGVRDPIGLCAACRHARVVRSSRGGTFYMCRLAETDPRFSKYPRLPIIRCAGYESISSGIPKGST